jgi:flagellar M-ring protein FliF
VSVISTDGTTLQRPSTDDSLAGGLGDTRTEQERAVAHQLETHVQSLIERVVGPGNAEVRANLRLSSATTERTAESYEPTKAALRSEQRSEEFSGGGGPGVAGVPGATTNLAGGEVEVAPGADAKLFRRNLTKNWEIDRVTEKTIIPAGSITKLTLSVLVNERLVGAPGEQTREPWDELELERLAEVAKNAVGFDEIRGDSFSIQSVAFVEPVKLPEPAPTPQVEEQLPIPWIAAAAGGALLLVILLIALVRSKKSAARAASVEVLRRLEEASQLTAPAQSPQLAGASSLEVEQLHERALELARRDPATAAFIIRSWIHSDNAGAPESATSNA